MREYVRTGREGGGRDLALGGVPGLLGRRLQARAVAGLQRGLVHCTRAAHCLTSLHGRLTHAYTLGRGGAGHGAGARSRACECAWVCLGGCVDVGAAEGTRGLGGLAGDVGDGQGDGDGHVGGRARGRARGVPPLPLPLSLQRTSWTTNSLSRSVLLLSPSHASFSLSPPDPSFSLCGDGQGEGKGRGGTRPARSTCQNTTCSTQPRPPRAARPQVPARRAASPPR